MAFFKGAAKEAQRALQLKQQREKDHQEIENQKRKLEAEMRVDNMTSKFTVHYDAIEQRLKSDTVGLVTLDQMKARQEAVIHAREQQLASAKNKEARLTEAQRRAERSALKRKGALSFNFDEEEEEDDESDEDKNEHSLKSEHHCDEKKKSNIKSADVEVKIESDTSDKIDSTTANDDIQSGSLAIQSKRKRLGKNPDVDTSFLPDIDREEEENRLREELRKEWVSKQESIKEEEIEITYSYWDGSGHRRQVRMKKGHSISQFLHRAVDQLRREFPELRSASADQLMYVKEDLIIPHHYTFYDFIVTKARGKSGPLFVFDQRDDIRLLHDASVEKEESHAGKVCQRSWYERHKHIFPASRWEPYDPTKNWDQYTVSDKLAVKITVK